MPDTIQLTLTAIHCSLHALETLFLEMHPDKKEELESLFLEEMTKARAVLARQDKLDLSRLGL